VSAGWVAAQVRSRSLAGHCLGPAGVREVAGAGSLDGALALLATSSYGPRLHLGLDLATSEHEVFASVLWNLRVLAGWSPAMGASRLHVLAGVFELANLRGHLARIEGYRAPAPFDLGSLAAVADRQTPATIPELRDALRRSDWGDPGAADAAGVYVALQFALARRIVDEVTEAGAWAQTYAALVMARLIVQDCALDGDSNAAANARIVLGSRAVAARSLEELRRALARDVASVLEGVEGPADLWLADSRWWTHLFDDAQARLRHSAAGPEAVVAAAAVLFADAWRVQMAMEIAARAGRGIEVLDAVA
jgi:hypothetical protein